MRQHSVDVIIGTLKAIHEIKHTKRSPTCPLYD